MEADVLKDPRVAMFQSALTQCGRGQPIQVFRGTSRYQYGAGFGDVLRSIWRFVFPVAKHGLATLMKVGGEAYMQNGNAMGAIKSAIKPTVGSLIKSTGEEIERRMESASSSTASPPEPPARHLDASEVGTAPPNKQHGAGRKASSSRRRHPNIPFGVYKGGFKRACAVKYPHSNFGNFNF